MADLSTLSNDQLLALAGQNGSLGNLTNAQLMAQAANSSPSMSSAEDLGRSAVTGLQQGVTGLLGLGGDAINAFGHTQDRLGIGAFSALQDMTGSKLGAPTMLSQHKSVMDDGSINGVTPPNYANQVGATTSAQLNAARQQLTGPDHVPQTTAGRYGQRIAEFAPGLALGPESLLAKAATTVGAGTASQAAEDVVPDSFKPYAAALGAAIGGGAVAGARAIKNAPQAALAKALKSATPDDVAQATDLMRRGQQLPGGGVNVTPYEALGHITGSPAAPRIQHFIENARGSNVDVGNLFSQQRPAQVSSTVNALADSIAPAPTQPGMLGQQVQGAATDALSNVRQGINTATRPLYQAAETQLVPDADYQALAQNESFKKGLAAVRSDPEINAAVAHLPDNSIAVVDAVKRQLGTLADNARPTPVSSGDNYVAGLRDAAAANTAQTARAASPQYAQALDQQAAMRQANLAPLQAGALGAISSTPDLTSQLGALFGKSPTVGASNETGQAINAIGPDLGQSLLAQHLRDTFNNSSRDLVTGPNSYAGSKFAKDIAGHAEQARALAEGLTAAGVNPSAPGGVNDALDVLRATGQRQAPGSGTAFNQQQRDALGIAPAAVRTLGAIFDPLEYGKHLTGAVGKAMYGRQLDHFGQLLNASPDQAEAMLNAARSSPSKGALLGRMLLSTPTTTTSP